jgi:predicted dehydrogenase
VWVNFILKALESNKHVYSEKPHGGTVCELKSVLDLAKEKNLQWIDGTIWSSSMI